MLSVELVPIRVPSLAPGRIDQHQPNWPHSYQETTAARHQKKERRVWEGSALRKESLDNTFDIGSGQGSIQTKWEEKWDGRARQNYLNKLEGNRKRLINPIGPAGEDWQAQKYDQIIFNKSTKNCLRGSHDWNCTQKRQMQKRPGLLDMWTAPGKGSNKRGPFY